MADSTASAPSTVVRLVKTDLPAKNRRPIRDAVQTLYSQIFREAEKKKQRGSAPSRNAQRAELAKSLKVSMDRSFGPHWHVLVGEKSGFACKKRDQSMGIFRVEENQVVIWQSPGIEELEAAGAGDSQADATKAGVAAAGENEEGTAGEGFQREASAAETAPALKVLEPSDVKEESETARVVATLRQALAVIEDDPQALATRVRKRLTAEFGTIWHVIAGSDFAVQAAEDRRNHVLVTSGKTRLLCYQHEQFMNRSTIDWGRILRSAPYLLLAIFCLTYMTMQTQCGDEDPTTGPPSQFKTFVRDNLCKGDWEENVNKVGMAALACLFFSKMGKKFSSISQKKVKKA